MERRILTNPVTIHGRGAFGGDAELTLKPTDQPGIFWSVEGEDIPLSKTRISAHPRFHFLALSYGRSILRVPEHLLGFLYACGIDEVSIHSKRLPYDGCAKQFYEQILGAEDVRTTGKFAYYTVNEPVEVSLQSGRTLQFIPNESPGALEYEIKIDYRGIGRYALCSNLFAADLRQLACSRAFGRGYLKFLSERLGRFEQYVWLDDTGPKGLEEIAQHRLLDLLGALTYVTPPKGRLVGKVVSPPFAGHRTDMLLLEGIDRVGLHKVL